MCPIPCVRAIVPVSFNIALVTKYPTYREDVELEYIFKAYTKRHYESWVTFSRDTGHGDDNKPVLVTGVEMTRDFAMIPYSNDSVSLTSEFSTAVPHGCLRLRLRLGDMAHRRLGPHQLWSPALLYSVVDTDHGSNTLRQWQRGKCSG